MIQSKYIDQIRKIDVSVSNSHCTVLVSQTSTSVKWKEENVYVAELLNRFIGNRVSNVAISPAWPWTRKLNDRSINSLIPAVRTPAPARRWLDVVVSYGGSLVDLYSSHRRARYIAASETIARGVTTVGHSSKTDLPQLPSEWDEKLSLELIPAVKNRWILSLQIRDRVDFTPLEYKGNCEIRRVRFRSGEFPFWHKVREQTRSTLIRAGLARIYGTCHWEYRENRNVTIRGDWEYRREFADNTMYLVMHKQWDTPLSAFANGFVFRRDVRRAIAAFY